MKSCLISLICILFIIKDDHAKEVEVKIGDPIQLCCGLDFAESDSLAILSENIRLSLLFQKKVNDADISKFRKKFPKYSDIKISLIDSKLCLTKEVSSVENDNFSILCQVTQGGMFATLGEETLTVRVYEELKFTVKPQEKVDALIGVPLIIPCAASGSPDLQILWRNKEQGKLVSGTSSVDLKLDNITSEMNRKEYTCEASTSIPKNKAASVINQKVTLDVLYKPEIMVDMAIVHTDLGVAEEVNITVTGNPQPKFECQILNFQTDRIVTISSLTPFTYMWKMEFLNISQKHIKDYECTAYNSQGEAKKTISLYLIPGSLIITSGNNTDYYNHYVLEWGLHSKSDIQNVTVTIDIIKADGSSTKRLEILQDKELKSCLRLSNAQEGKWKKSYLHALTNLTENVLHQISLNACNRHGCTDSANLVYVSTPADNGKNKYSAKGLDPLHSNPDNSAPTIRWKSGFLFFVAQSTAIVLLPLVSWQLY